MCSKELGWPVRLMVLIVGLCLLLLLFFFVVSGFVPLNHGQEISGDNLLYSRFCDKRWRRSDTHDHARMFTLFYVSIFSLF